MELKPLEIKITSLGDRSPGDLRAQVRFQVDGGPKYVIKAIRVDVRDPFINYLISSVKELHIESEGEEGSAFSDQSRVEEIPKTSYGVEVSAGVPGYIQVSAKWGREK